MRGGFAATIAALVLLGPVRARGDDAPGPLEYRLKVDAPITAAAAAVWITGEVVQPYVLTSPPCDPCYAGTIDAIDRGLAGQRNSYADAISWATLGLALAAPLAVDGLDVWKSHAGWRAWLTDAGLLLETLTIDGAFNQVVKLIAHRPRPFVYGLPANDPAFSSSESFVSYFSEHSSLTFAAAAYCTTLFALRHPRRRGWAAAVGVGAFALAAVTAALRVVAGKHFYTDVLAGAAVGTIAGASIPLLHQRRVRLPISITPIQSGALASFTWIH